jgi:hypothetical protein
MGDTILWTGSALFVVAAIAAHCWAWSRAKTREHDSSATRKVNITP